MNTIITYCKFKKSLSLPLIISLIFVSSLYSQKKEYQAATIGFYNLENLFDVYPSAGLVDGNLDPQDQFYHTSIKIEDIPSVANDTVDCKCRLTEKNLKGKKVIRELILQNEFSPDGPKAWTKERYNQKLKNLSKVISEIGSDVTKTAPVVVGVVEVENREVMEDLINQEVLKPYNYGVVHYNSWDKRGIDVGLIYQKNRFIVQHTQKYELEVYNTNGYRDYTRDILRVDGLLDGEKIHFIVNHWPSRRGGEAASSPKREAAGALLKEIFDEIRKNDPEAKIIAMGDFNDDPVNNSMKTALGAKGNKNKIKKGDIFNPMYDMFEKGFGTLAYRDGWNLFDQIVTSHSLVGNEYKSYQMYKTEIFSPLYLINKEGKYKGYPNRMYGGDTYRSDGYSDHFPVYTILLRELAN